MESEIYYINMDGNNYFKVEDALSIREARRPMYRPTNSPTSLQ